MKWLAIVYDKQGFKFYVRVDLSLTPDVVLAKSYTSREEALDAATDASFDGESIDALEVDE